MISYKNVYLMTDQKRIIEEAEGATLRNETDGLLQTSDRKEFIVV